jgi:hypothetical protein
MDQWARIHLSNFDYLHFRLQFGRLISSHQGNRRLKAILIQGAEHWNLDDDATLAQSSWVENSRNRGTDQHRRKARAIEELCEQGPPG